MNNPSAHRPTLSIVYSSRIRCVYGVMPIFRGRLRSGPSEPERENMGLSGCRHPMLLYGRAISFGGVLSPLNPRLPFGIYRDRPTFNSVNAVAMLRSAPLLFFTNTPGYDKATNRGCCGPRPSISDCSSCPSHHITSFLF